MYWRESGGGARCRLRRRSGRLNAQTSQAPQSDKGRASERIRSIRHGLDERLECCSVGLLAWGSRREQHSAAGRSSQPAARSPQQQRCGFLARRSSRRKGAVGACRRTAVGPPPFDAKGGWRAQRLGGQRGKEEAHLGWQALQTLHLTHSGRISGALERLRRGRSKGGASASCRERHQRGEKRLGPNHEA